MKAMWTLAICAWPLGASAELIFVDYSGAVVYDELLAGCGCSGEEARYAVGDRLSGQLIIDTSLAPPNTSVVFPGRFASYGDDGTRSADFVQGFNPASQFSNDSVFVQNGPNIDAYRVTDLHRTDASTYSLLTLTVVSANNDLFDDTDIVQSFAVTRADKPNMLFGLLQRATGAIRRTVGFELDSLQVTPGRCLR
jgi:hypothetical protein